MNYAHVCHYNDVIMSPMASQITSLAIVYSTVYSGTDQRKYQSSASLAFVRGIHRSSVNSPHKGPVTRKTFPFDDVIMTWFAFCCVMLWLVTGRFYPYPSGLLHWNWGNRAIAPVPVKTPWRLWVIKHVNPTISNNLTTTQQNPTKPNAYFM